MVLLGRASGSAAWGGNLHKTAVGTCLRSFPWPFKSLNVLPWRVRAQSPSSDGAPGPTPPPPPPWKRSAQGLVLAACGPRSTSVPHVLPSQAGGTLAYTRVLGHHRHCVCTPHPLTNDSCWIPDPLFSGKALRGGGQLRGLASAAPWHPRPILAPNTRGASCNYSVPSLSTWGQYRTPQVEG